VHVADDLLKIRSVVEEVAEFSRNICELKMNFK